MGVVKGKRCENEFAAFSRSKVTIRFLMKLAGLPGKGDMEEM